MNDPVTVASFGSDPVWLSIVKVLGLFVLLVLIVQWHFDKSEEKIAAIARQRAKEQWYKWMQEW